MNISRNLIVLLFIALTGILSCKDKTEPYRYQQESYPLPKNQELPVSKGVSKLELCRNEFEQKSVGEDGFMMGASGGIILTVRETVTLKCEYGELYTSGRVFNKSTGTREDLAWSKNSDNVVCPEVAKKYGSICN